MKKNTKIFLIVFGIIVFIIILYIFNRTAISSFGTDPQEVLNYTQGEFTIKTHEYVSFEDFYEQLGFSDEKSLLEEYAPSKFDFKMPELKYDYKTYDYEPGYYDVCTGRRLEINFSQQKYSEFKFNYSDKIFNYKINLYKDLYSFSDTLKGQDCYFDTDKYVESFLEDPYNNYFIDAVSRDFISLKNDGYSNDEIVEIATIFVQSIPYGTDSSELNRYPYETFYENEGNCLDKSLILVGILKNLGYTSYIFSGDSDGEGHALAGIVCDKGNVNYNNQEICFIETTIYTPISSEDNIDIDDYIKTSNGTLIYSGVNYGRSLIDYFDTKEVEINITEAKISDIKDSLINIERDMCKTDCVICGEAMFGIELVDWEKSEKITRCDGATRFNRLLKDYNKDIDEYNSLIKEWYVPYYDLEKSMFGNVELLER